MMMGRIYDKRIAHIQGRLDCINKGEAPDPSAYQDHNGKAKKWTQEEMDGTENSWSFWRPRSWLYGGASQPALTHVCITL